MAAKKPMAKKPVAKKASAKKPSAASARMKAAGNSVGEQIYARVEELKATGRTAKDAFTVVAKEQKMTTSNIQQHYYRFKRKATTSGKKANTSTRRTASKMQGSAITAAATAASKIPPKQRKQVAKGVTAAAKRAQTAQTMGKEVREDLSQVVDELMTSLHELLAEARKNPQFRKAEKKIASRFWG
jgi:hypothetical protein